MTATLREVLSEYGPKAYLLTMSSDGPHTSHVSVVQDKSGLSCAVSKSAARNISEKTPVSLLWPPLEKGGYSIVVNADATKTEKAGIPTVKLALTKAVFHRPGQPTEDTPGVCRSDCKSIALD